MGVEHLAAGEEREATVTLGFLLLAAVFGGKAVAGLGLPAITGYILVGLAVGESLLGLVSQADIGRLGLVDDVAISLIALSAGGELKLSELRERASSMLGILVSEMGAVFVVVAGAFLMLAPWMPFTAELPVREALTMAMIFGAIAIANSPSVAIAVINDSGARGPVSSTILGVTVLKDVAVILLFAVALSVARTLLAPEAAFETGFFVDVGWKLGGSILVGAASGWLVSFALQRSNVSKVLLALAAAFFNAEIAVLLDLEILILSLTAGFFVENVSPVHGEPFVEGVEANSLPLYALFFSLAGAGILLADLAALWPVVLAFVALRAGAIFGGTWLGARLTDSEPEVERYAWLGFVSQAGVTLGMVVIAGNAFPEWGDQLRTIFVSMVAVHELIGPAMMQYGLNRAGETGARETMAEEPARA
jgi:Kef-type K+ transport system membrane component KefB